MLADWTRDAHPSSIQALLASTTDEQIIPFALGLPDPALFPREQLEAAAYEAIAKGDHVFQYAPPSESLKSHIVQLMKLRGVECTEQQIFLTTGAQQGMSLLLKLLLNPGNPLLVEPFIYSGFRQAMAGFMPRLIIIDSDQATGINVDSFEAALKRIQQPTCCYMISDGHNPLGISLALQHRQRLIEIAQHYECMIIEDDAYGLLALEEASIAPMRAMNTQQVCYLGSFSKILAPALRTGWIIAPERLIPLLSYAKEGSDINTATFMQHLLSSYLDANDFTSHLARLRQTYRQRRDKMVTAAEQYLPSGTKWSVPSHGFFLWVELPLFIDTNALLEEALDQEHFTFIPGENFAITTGHGKNNLRLSFSCAPPLLIGEGIRRLGNLLNVKLGKGV